MLQTINRDHIRGALVGIGICAVGYYVYKKNQSKVETFLRSKGIDVPQNTSKDYRAMSLEELMETKELVEDVIAEREMADSENKKNSEDIASDPEV